MTQPMDEMPPQAAEALVRAFAAEDDPPASVARPTLDDVRAYLRRRIAALLDRRPELLMSILYRIDVSEPDVKRALSDTPPGALPDVLAELVLQRQLQKQALRRRYGGA